MAFLDFQAYIRQSLSRFSPSDARKGTAVDELSVKPVAALLMDVNDQMSAVVQLQDINQSSGWSDSQVAAYGRFFKLPWITGKKASGYVRVYVDQPVDIKVRTATVTAFSRQGNTFNPAFDTNISSIEFGLDKAKGLYWVDLAMISSGVGSNFNIPAGSITRVDGLGIDYKSVTNPDDFVDGSAGESRDEYLDRLSYASSDRAVLGHRSIKAALRQLFPVVKSVYIAGAGDVYMTRDALPIPGKEAIRASYLGKTPGVMTVPHTAYRDVFPPEPDAATQLAFGTQQPVSDYDIPVAVVSVDYLNSDPAKRGFRLNREFSSDDYSGLYFDDGLTGSGISTGNTLDFSKTTPFTGIMPGSDWVYGDAGRDAFDFETHRDTNGDEIPRADYASLQASTLSFKTGASEMYTYASSELYRNSGLAISGTLQVSDAVGAEHMVMIGAGYDNMTFTGLGFGLSKIIDDETDKWVFYISHNGKSSLDQVFIKPDDVTGSSLGGISTLVEHIIPANTITVAPSLWFMMHVDSDFNVAVTLVDSATGVVIDTISISGPVARQIQNTISNSPASFGTRVRFVANCRSDQAISFSDVVCRDTNPRRPTALLLVDITGFEAPLTVSLKARGAGAYNGSGSYGYRVYAWDNEAPVMTGNIAGAWAEIAELGDQGEAEQGFYTGKTWEITALDRYRCLQLSDNTLALAITSAQPSFTATQYNQSDIDATVDIDYVKISGDSDISARLGNCVDIYVNTYNNTENRGLVSITAEASNGLISLMPSQPIMAVSSVVGPGGDITADVKVVYDNDSYAVKIYTPGQDNSTYAITYVPYYAVESIQKFFDSKSYGAVVGGIRVKHKIPVDLEINWSYSGSGDQSSIDSAIRKYVDSRPDEVFDMTLCFQSLYQQGLCSSMGSDSICSYVDPETGLWAQQQRVVVRPIDFFRITSIQVSRK